jgi:serine protease
MSLKNKKSWAGGWLIAALCMAPAAAAEFTGLRVMLRPDAQVVPVLAVQRVTVTGALETSLPAGWSEAAVRARMSALRADPAVLWVQPMTSVAEKDGAPVLGRRVLVRLKPESAKRGGETSWEARLDAWQAAAGVALKSVRAGDSLTYIVESAVPHDLVVLAQLIERDPEVLFADPVIRFHPMRAPSDPLYSLQWNYHHPISGINAPAAWDISTGGPVTVAVVDTGILPHPDLINKTLPGYDMISDPEIALDGDGRDADAFDSGDWIEGPQCGSEDPIWEASSWHGSHVAGVIGAQANNGQGIAGVSWGARILPLRVLGRCGGEFTDVADGVLWAAGVPVAGAPVNPYPAKVINMSLGGKGSCPRAMQQAVDAALLKGAVVVVAAGNSNRDTAGYAPANCGGVITVASHTLTGDKAYYSNYGPVVELSAPGGEFWSYEGVLSTISDGPRTALSYTYAEYQGTSMAAPHVAGVAALLLSRNPELMPGQLMNLLTATARAHPAGSTCGGDTSCGAGMVDAAAALLAVPAGGWGVDDFKILVREFHNTILNHYFLTADASEAAALVSGSVGPGWQATGYSFHAYRPLSIAPANSWPVCRFYGTPGLGPNSHFFTGWPYECAAVSRDDGWWYEGVAFNIPLPFLGACDWNTIPVYRADNGRWVQNDSNHRYLTSLSEYQRMLGLGWHGEGVVMCAPAEVTITSGN